MQKPQQSHARRIGKRQALAAIALAIALAVVVLAPGFAGAAGSGASAAKGAAAKADVGGKAARSGGAGVNAATRATLTELNCPGPGSLGFETLCVVNVVQNGPHQKVAPTGNVFFTSNGPGQFGGIVVEGEHFCHLEENADLESSFCIITYKPTALGSGTHGILAAYGGDNTYKASQNEQQLKIVRPVSASFSCPQPMRLNQPTTCAAFVTETQSTSNPTAPPGTIKWTSNGSGTFSNGGNCNLASSGVNRSSCTVTYTPTAIGPGTHELKTTYVPAASNYESKVAVANVSIIHPSSTTLECDNETELEVLVECVVTVRDIVAAPVPPQTPAGFVTFTSSGAGKFSGEQSGPPAKCQLTGSGAVSVCVITYIPTSSSPSIHDITANFAAQNVHETSSSSAPVIVKGEITRFAAPQATGSAPCTDPASPCRLDVAATTAKAGDEIVLAPGTYVDSGQTPDLGPTGTLALKESVRLRGAIGKSRPLIQISTEGAPAEERDTLGAVVLGKNDIVSNLGISDTAAVHRQSLISIRTGLVQNVLVEAHGAPTACALTGGLLRDSACITDTPKGLAVGGSVLLNEQASPVSAPSLRNVTAIATAPLSVGIGFAATNVGPGSPQYHVTANNVIAAGGVVNEGGRQDVVASGQADTGKQPAQTTIDFSHSAFAFTQILGNGAIGKSAQVTEAPKLAADHYHELAGSPTIDAGEADQLTGLHDLDGTDRVVNGKPDVGADEVGLPSSTSLSCDAGPIVVGTETAKCTATVTATTSGDRAPGGSVDFTSSGSGTFSQAAAGPSQPFCELTPTGTDGQSSCQIFYTARKRGPSPSHTITAKYGREADHSASEDARPVAVLASTSLNFTCTSTEIVGEANPAKCSVTVADLGPEPEVLSGRVHVEIEGPATAGPCSLSGPSPSLQTCTFNVLPGSFNGSASADVTVKVKYSEDLVHPDASGSASIHFELRHHATQTTVKCDSPTNGTANSNCIATVVDQEGGQFVPKGSASVSVTGPGTTNPEKCSLAAKEKGTSVCSFNFIPAKPLEVGAGEPKVTASYEGGVEKDKAALDPSQGSAVVQVSAPTKVNANCPNVATPHAGVICNLEVMDVASVSELSPRGEVTLSSSGPVEFPGGKNTCSLAATGDGKSQSICLVTVIPTGAGDQQLTASYAGSKFHRASSGTKAMKVTDRTKTSVTCTPSSVRSGDLSSCVAAVEDLDGPAPTGSTVNFSATGTGSFSGPSSCELSSPVGSTASCAVLYKAESPGAHQVTGTLAADSQHKTSSGSGEVTVRNTGDQTATALTCQSPVGPGQPAQCSASVRDTSATAQPGGEVVFTSDRAGVFSKGGACTLERESPDSAGCSLTYTPSTTTGTGNHHITASYQGDLLPSQSSKTIEVVDNRLDSSTKVSCDPNPALPGHDATCTATVEDASGQPAGLVRVEVDGPGAEVTQSNTCGLVGAGPNSSTCAANVHFDDPIQASAGVHHVTADFLGSTAQRPSTGSTQVAVSQPTATRLSCAPSGLPGTLVPCKVEVEDISEEATVPTGSVTLKTDKTNSEGSFIPKSSCDLSHEEGEGSAASCSFSYEGKALGDHHLTASFPGEEQHGGSEDHATITIADNRAPVVVKLACEPTLITNREPTSCKATVEPSSPPGSTALGTVSFKTGSTGTFSPLSCELREDGAGSGISSCSVSYQPGEPAQQANGTHKLTAEYGGDNDHQRGEGSTEIQVKDKTTTVLSCVSPVAAGQASACVATVLDSTNPLAPQGEVRFTSSSTEGSFSKEGKCQLERTVDGVSACELTYTPNAGVANGLHTITATYGGGPQHRGSEGTAPINVEKEATSTSLVCDPSDLVLGSGAVECAVTVEDTGSSRSVPTGSVNFSLSHTNQGSFSPGESCQLGEAQEGRRASCKLTYVPAAEGEQEITAAYPGDDLHGSSQDTKTVSVTANAGSSPTSTAIACAPSNPHAAEDATTCTATVEDIGSSRSVPGGFVHFSHTNSGGFVPAEASCELVNPEEGKRASCAVEYAPQATGEHEVTALYPGDDAHEPSSDTKTITAVAAVHHRTGTSISCQPQRLPARTTTDCTVTVRDETPAGEASAPTGEVQLGTDGEGAFSESSCDELSSGNGDVAATCHAVYTPTLSGEGLHHLSATYKGDGEHAESPGTTTLRVVPRTEVRLNCSPESLLAGESTRCTATVADLSENPTTPRGEVEFESDLGGTFSGPCELEGNADTATCFVDYQPDLAADANLAEAQVTATYPGDENHGDSTRSVLVTVHREATTGGGDHPTETQIACTPNALVAGTLSFCTATVSDTFEPASDRSTPHGDVVFTHTGQGTFLGGPQQCALTGSGSSASCLIAYRPDEAGEPKITATYQPGADSHEESSKSTLLRVDPAGGGSTGKDETESSIACQAAGAAVGDTIGCTITVKDKTDPAGKPGGGVSLQVSGVSASFPASSSCALGTPQSGEASCEVRVKLESAGTATARGSYEGSDAYGASQGIATFDVAEGQGGGGEPKNDTATAIACDPSPATATQKTTCTVTVSDSNQDTAARKVPTGKVAFSSDKQPQASFEPANGECELAGVQGSTDSASCTVEYTPAAQGTDAITAAFSGAEDNSHNGSTKTIALPVNGQGGGGEPKNDTATAIACDPSPATATQKTTCTVTVSDSNQDTAARKVPTGKVAFSSDKQPQASFEPANGECELAGVQGSTDSASCTVEYTPAAQGTDAITATFGGDDVGNGHNGSTKTIDLTVNGQGGGGAKSDTATAISCNPAPATATQATTCDGDGLRQQPGHRRSQGADRQGRLQLRQAAAGQLRTGQRRMRPDRRPGLHGLGLLHGRIHPGRPGHRRDHRHLRRRRRRQRPQRLDQDDRPDRQRPGRRRPSPPRRASAALRTRLRSAAARATARRRSKAPRAARPRPARSNSKPPPMAPSPTPALCQLSEVSAGKASCGIDFRPSDAGAGIEITGSYAGDTGHEPSQGSDQIDATEAATPLERDVIELACSPDSAKVSEAVGCKATVTGPQGRPSGQVAFASNGTGAFSEAAVCTLGDDQSSAQASSCEVEYTPVAVGSGHHRVFATYEAPGAVVGPGLRPDRRRGRRHRQAGDRNLAHLRRAEGRHRCPGSLHRDGRRPGPAAGRRPRGRSHLRLQRHRRLLGSRLRTEPGPGLRRQLQLRSAVPGRTARQRRPPSLGDLPQH